MVRATSRVREAHLLGKRERVLGPPAVDDHSGEPYCPRAECFWHEDGLLSSVRTLSALLLETLDLLRHGYDCDLELSLFDGRVGGLDSRQVSLVLREARAEVVELWIIVGWAVVGRLAPRIRRVCLE